MKKTFECEATLENLDKATAFVEGELEELGCGMKQMMHIAHYAYAKTDANGKQIPDTGSGPMTLSLETDQENVYMTFEDEGVYYNPLEKEDPDVSLSVEEREIGGLGIFMVKKSMDDVIYKREGEKNILTLVKKL